MELNDYEKMVYRSLLSRKIDKLDISEEAKKEFIDSVIKEASSKFHQSFSLYLRDMFNKRLKQLNEKEGNTLTKKEYKLILTLKDLEENKTVNGDYKDNRSFNTILNQVLKVLINDQEKLEKAINIYPNIKKYVECKKSSISMTDLKILDYLEVTKLNIVSHNDRKLKYKVNYLTNKLNSFSKEIIKIYPNACKTLQLISLGLTVKEVEIFYILKENISIKEKAEKLGYSDYNSYSKALDKLYEKIRDNEGIKDIALSTYPDIINMIEKRDVLHHRIKLRSINKEYIMLFKKKLIVKKAPKVVSISNSYLPYTLRDEIYINNTYLNNKGYFISSSDLNTDKVIKKVEEVTKDFKDLTLKERYEVAFRLGYIKTSLKDIDNLWRHPKTLHKILERRVK